MKCSDKKSTRQDFLFLMRKLLSSKNFFWKHFLFSFPLLRIFRIIRLSIKIVCKKFFNPTYNNFFISFYVCMKLYIQQKKNIIKLTKNKSNSTLGMGKLVIKETIRRGRGVNNFWIIDRSIDMTLALSGNPVTVGVTLYILSIGRDERDGQIKQWIIKHSNFNV